LYLSKGEVYVKTLLERARGSALDITVNHTNPIGAMALLPPHNKQIKHLHFASSYWEDVQRFSEANSGPLPLLTTLKISIIVKFNMEYFNEITPPPLPLFSSAINLKKFVLHSDALASLDRFGFPNLTTFKLLVTPEDGFYVSQLLSFLEASPALQKVDMRIVADILFEGIPRERVVVLPDVETFRLSMTDGGPGYRMAAHISCPSARHTLITHDMFTSEMATQEIFPSSASWNAIARQYSRSPVEEVALEMQVDSNRTTAFSLTFRSSNATAIELGFKITANDKKDRGFLEEAHYKIFSRASKTIRDHPLLANVRRLHFDHNSYLFGSTQRGLIANQIGRIFKSVGPLEKLVIDGCDLRSYFIPFFDSPEIEQPVTFPQVEELAVLHPLPASQKACMSAIVGLAKSQHALGVPFKHVTVHMTRLPKSMAEELGKWVETVDCGCCEGF
jgi:hypothetical protein